MHLARILAALSLFPSLAAAQPTTIGSPIKASKGGWILDQSVRQHLSNMHAAHITGLPVGDQTVALDLTRFEVLAPDAIVVEGTSAGDIALPRPDVQLWRGSIAGISGSYVFLAISPDTINGYAAANGQAWIISSGRAGSPVIIDTTDNLARRGVRLEPPACQGVIDAPGAPIAVPNVGGADGPRSWPCRSFRVAIDCDYEFTQDLFGGNATSSAAYAVTLLGAVSEIYQRDTNIVIEVGYLRTWTTSADPYTSANTSDQLPQFRNYWNQNMGAVPRHLAHLLSGRSLGGGIAYGNVACHATHHYGVSSHMAGFFPYPIQSHHAQNWDLMVVAHEMGHNLGSRHTHEVFQYNPPIDGCGNAYLNPPQTQDCSQAWNGTIMSYCHLCPGGMTNMNMTFGTRVSTAIRAYVDGAASSCGGFPTLAITQHPQSVAVAPATNAVLTVAASGPTPISYQWRRNQTPITSTGHYIGAQSPQLTIVAAQQQDIGQYDVVVTNVCGSLTSQSATVSITTPCYANCDNSGPPLLSANDFICFLNAFATGQSYANCDNSSTEPTLTANDFQCFVNAFASGCS